MIGAAVPNCRPLFGVFDDMPAAWSLSHQFIPDIAGRRMR